MRYSGEFLRKQERSFGLSKNRTSFYQFSNYKPFDKKNHESWFFFVFFVVFCFRNDRHLTSQIKLVHSNPSGYLFSHLKNSHILPTQCIYVFCMDLRTNSDYFPTLHHLTAVVLSVLTRIWLMFTTVSEKLHSPIMVQ